MKINKHTRAAKKSLAKQSAIKKFMFFIAGICLGFFQTVFLTPDSCAQTAGPQASGPIDIQANEQEFLDAIVLAKGNVTVTYKDSIVKAPEAKLFRDPNGQPQKAIFVGHPYLTQNDNKISADTLIFEIAESKFIAQGNAHSEVSSEGDAQVDPKAPPGKSGKMENKKENKSEGIAKGEMNSKNEANSKTLAAAKGSNSSKQPFAWPQASDDQNAFQKPTNNITASQPGNKVIEPSNKANESGKKPSTDKTAKEGTPEKIITDSDYQEYSKESGKFDASGHVHVIHGEVSVFADKLKLVYGNDGKPETALFNGHVNAFQGTNNTQAETVTYYLATKRLQAAGNVHSRMIQKQDGSENKGATNKKVVGAQPNAGGAIAAPNATGIQSDEDPIIVVSDAQDMNQNTGKMTAEGNVRVYYQDMTGAGPKVLLLRNADGRAEKVIFTERSQVSQPGKRWIADRITMAIATKKILAEGNTKAFIIGTPGRPAPQANSALAARSSGKTASTVAVTDKNKTSTVAGSNKNEIY